MAVDTHLVTGYAGEEHITSANIASLQSVLTDGKSKVLTWGGFDVHAVYSGDVFANALTVNAGYGIAEGRVFNLQFDDEVGLEPVSVGMYEKDLVVARYEKDSTSNEETMVIDVVSGTPATRESSAQIPTYQEGLIEDGDNPVEFPIFLITRSYNTISISRGKYSQVIDETYIDEAYIEDKWNRYNVMYGGGRRY